MPLRLRHLPGSGELSIFPFRFTGQGIRTGLPHLCSAVELNHPWNIFSFLTKPDSPRSHSPHIHLPNRNLISPLTPPCLKFLTILQLCAAVLAAEFPAPKSLGATETFGRNLQSTMKLLTDSTPEKRNTVRVLFYGQSITEQNWSKIVADDLRTRFPHANLVIENRALGVTFLSCSSKRRKPISIRSNQTSSFSTSMALMTNMRTSSVALASGPVRKS